MIKVYEGYQIKPHPANPMSLVVTVDGKGGRIPAVLEGLFTSPVLAQRAIDMYLLTKDTDGSDKTKPKSRG